MKNKKHRNLRVLHPPPAAPPPPMAYFDEEEEKGEAFNLIPKLEWFTKLVSFQSDIIYNCITTLSSPLQALLSTANESYRRTETTAASFETTILKVLPSKVSHGSMGLVKKVGMGVMGAVQMGAVLTAVMVVAVVLGVGLVELWVEEPVFVKDKLFFDYTDANPKAAFGFQTMGGVPVGHRFYVSLVLLMPESDYNRQIGVFQVTAEVLTANGTTMAKSSQPCMLRFRSFPIRLFRTFLMGMPLVLGICEETQKITLQLLKHKENYHQRTKAVRLTLMPRAGTTFLPQLYETEILIESELPWSKQLVRNWRWTCYIWASINSYILLLLFLLCYCRGMLLFPMTATLNDDSGQTGKNDSQIHPRDEMEVSEMMMRWREKRRKRKAIFLLQEDVGETAFGTTSAASSMSVTKEDTSVAAGEETVDSESVCLDG